MFSVVYSHLSKVLVKEGQILNYQDKIGIMGSTGLSSGNHLHIGVVDGAHTRLWRLADTARGNPKPNKTESDWFITGNDLFVGQDGSKRTNRITTPWNSQSYLKKYGDLHSAYDIVDNEPGIPYIVWNRGVTRPIPGKVVKVGYDGAHGNYVIVQYSYDLVPEPPKTKPGDIVKIDTAATDQIFGNQHLVIEGPEADGITWIRIGVSDKWVK